jgi:transcriptional/translational regulatory protein YebC/TACO1
MFGSDTATTKVRPQIGRHSRKTALRRKNSSIDDPGEAAVTRNKRGCVMSGHSKWATIKHKKGATDAKRGRVFTRIIREISIAARIGGGEPNSNPRLRTAILAAKAANMPGENVERAILRGTGQLEGEQYEEATFEGYGPGGVGMLIEVVTTNRNRVVGEFRHLMSKNGGNMAEAGAVGWMFSRKGEISVPKEAASEDKLLDLVLTKAGITPASAEIAMVPQNYIKLTGPQATQMVRLVEALEEHDDVQHVYANFDIDESEIQAAVGAN